MTFEFTALLWELLIAVHVEICLFVMAALAYLALFGNVMPRNHKLANSRRVKPFEDVAPSAKRTAHAPHAVDRRVKQAAGSSDYNNVMKQWSFMKKSATLPSTSLAEIVEAMQYSKREPAFIFRELKDFMTNHASELDMGYINDFLDALAKRYDSDLMEQIADFLPSIGLEPNVRTHEISLAMYFSARDFQAVGSYAARMKTNRARFSMRAITITIKAALKNGSVNEARLQFRDFKAMCSAAARTPSSAPRQFAAQIIEFLCKEHHLHDFVGEISGVPLTEEAVNMMLVEAISQHDISLTLTIEGLAREQQRDLSDKTYSLLLRGLSGDVANGTRVLDELFQRFVEFPRDLCILALGICVPAGDDARVDKLRKSVSKMDPAVFSAFVKLYIGRERYEDACDLYEAEFTNRAVSGSTQAEERQPFIIDSSLERTLMSAALRCGRTQLASGLLSSAPSDVGRHVAMIRTCASQGNLDGAVRVFESFERSSGAVNIVMYNAVIDACVACNNLTAAEDWMKRTKDAGVVDVVSYNTLIKAYLADGGIDKARELMEQMENEGVQPNRVTFNELINSAVAQRNRAVIWSIIDEMQNAGVKPNQVTCSILLKRLNAKTSESEIVRTMDLISGIEGSPDEVLVSSVVEACVRIGKPDLVAQQLSKLGVMGSHTSSNGPDAPRGSSFLPLNGAHTFGSLIKAYGFAKDIESAWRCWNEMRKRHIRPTSVTLGCMVDAIVNNGDPEAAFELVHQNYEDERCRGTVNSVIYCSILKGFAREKKLERAFAVYNEVQANNIDVSCVMYNTLIDVCARCGRMDRVPDLLTEMKEMDIKPNVITYSTMLKGYCLMGEMRTAFALLSDMREHSDLKPDEIMYNSLLDGCALHNLVDDGLRLLSEMRAEGIPPSNFTLSILIKLMSRARRLDAAFELVKEITVQYGFRPNVHVYTNLAQACISNRSLTRAMSVLEEMVAAEVKPESRMYSILIRASLQQARYEQADGLLRGALGLPGSLPVLSRVPCKELDSGLVNETLLGLADHKESQEIALQLLSDIKAQKPTVRIDHATEKRVTRPPGAPRDDVDRIPSKHTGADQRQFRHQGARIQRKLPRSAK